MKYLFRILLIVIGISIGAVVLFRFVEVPVTPLMLIRNMQQKERGENVRLYHEWVPLEEMSKYMPVAVIASEDQNFMSHNGFDVKAIESILMKEYIENGREGVKQGKMRGGSTITQQTAKNLFLWPGGGRGCGKDWRHISQCLLSYCGVRKE